MFAILLEDVKERRIGVLGDLLVFRKGELVDIAPFWDDPNMCNIEDRYNPPKKMIRMTTIPKHMKTNCEAYKKGLWGILYG